MYNGKRIDPDSIEDANTIKKNQISPSQTPTPNPSTEEQLGGIINTKQPQKKSGEKEKSPHQISQSNQAGQLRSASELHFAADDKKQPMKRQNQSQGPIQNQKQIHTQTQTQAQNQKLDLNQTPSNSASSLNAKSPPEAESKNNKAEKVIESHTQKPQTMLEKAFRFFSQLTKQKTHGGTAKKKEHVSSSAKRKEESSVTELTERSPFFNRNLILGYGNTTPDINKLRGEERAFVQNEIQCLPLFDGAISAFNFHLIREGYGKTVNPYFDGLTDTPQNRYLYPSAFPQVHQMVRRTFIESTQSSKENETEDSGVLIKPSRFKTGFWQDTESEMKEEEQEMNAKIPNEKKDRKVKAKQEQKGMEIEKETEITENERDSQEELTEKEKKSIYQAVLDVSEALRRSNNNDSDENRLSKQEIEEASQITIKVCMI